jgi:hypothetical protein
MHALRVVAFHNRMAVQVSLSIALDDAVKS